MQQDFLLVWKMKNGDEKAMDTFVRQYYAQILQYCSYHCADREWAQDLTQETFERFFRKLADYQHHGKSLNYLYTIARNLCIDWERKNRELAMENVVEAENERKKPLQDSRTVRIGQCGGTDEADGLDDKLLIEAALEKLPDKLREVVILHFFQELSMRETAGILRIGIPLAKYRIKKAKELLREFLGEEESF
ncbi:MAG: RNA polymerase sigma factor [Lachnospiraceae bacterium]|nr:RNA polymerase sigma factor [Lachnospiraceae bacterium]